MYPHYHTHISTSSNTCIHFIEYVYSHHRTHISPLHFVGVYVYTGAMNRTLQLRTDCDNAADGLQQRCKQIVIYTRTPTNTILSHHKTHTFAPQKPIGDKLGGSQKCFVKIIIVAGTNISHTQNKTLSSLLEYHFLNHYNRLYRVRITI